MELGTLPRNATDQDFAQVCYKCAQTPTFSLNVTPASLEVCTPADEVYNVDVGSVLGFSDPVRLSASGNPAGTTADFSDNPVTSPGSSTLNIGGTGFATAGSYSIDVTGTATAGTKSQTVKLNLFDILSTELDLLTPAVSAVNVSFTSGREPLCDERHWWLSLGAELFLRTSVARGNPQGLGW